MGRKQRYYDGRVSHRRRNTTIWSIIFMIVMGILEAFLRRNHRSMVPPSVRNWGRGRGRSGSSGYNAAPPPPRNDSGGSTGSWGDSGSGGRGWGGAGGSLDGKSGDTW
jgi:hypothetical protein